MTRLIVLRHAKSSWDHPDLSDHDRPLNARGIEGAGLIGAWLRENGWAPSHVHVSSAVRTQETWERTGLEAEVTVHRTLYLAAPVDIRRVLRRAEGEAVMVIGHNPGIAEFASRILGRHPVHPRFHDYPTAACTVAEVSVPWSELTWGQAQLEGFTVPRDLR
ncbi:MAG: SixA phosphatase family protein [Shimia sp.]